MEGVALTFRRLHQSPPNPREREILRIFELNSA
jgi:hypothetical protein